MLNPETNSDSPSAKSNGVRFVSARHEISHTPILGINNNHLHQYEFKIITKENLMETLKLKKNIRIKANITS